MFVFHHAVAQSVGCFTTKQKAGIANSFNEYFLKGELNSISSDFIVSKHTCLIFLKQACASFNNLYVS